MHPELQPQIHLALASDQAIANLTPLLDPEFRPKQLLLLVSPEQQQQAAWLAEVVRPRGIKVSEWPVDNGWDIEHLRERIWALLESLEPGAVALNASAGTRPMCIAAYEVFRDWQYPIFYVHPQQDRVIWMHPSERPGRDLADRIRLEPFLQACGTRVESLERAPVAAARAELAQGLVRDLSRLGGALRVLNGIANTAQNSRLKSSRRLGGDDLESRPLQDLLERFSQGGLLRLEQRALQFPDEASRFFANGGWMEEYVFDSLHRLRSEIPAIQDLARSVNVLREGPRGRIPNELDVVLLADNRLYLIECKTRGWAGRGRPKESAPGAEALYKLDSIRDVMGGLQAQAMLVSYQEMPAHDRTRAADLGVQVCAGSQIQQLKCQLSDWIG